MIESKDKPLAEDAAQDDSAAGADEEIKAASREVTGETDNLPRGSIFHKDKESERRPKLGLQKAKKDDKPKEETPRGTLFHKQKESKD